MENALLSLQRRIEDVHKQHRDDCNKFDSILEQMGREINKRLVYLEFLVRDKLSKLSEEKFDLTKAYIGLVEQIGKLDKELEGIEHHLL